MRKEFYIGTLNNRDLDVYDKIIKFYKLNYNIGTVNLFKKGSNSFNAKYLKKKLKKYPISLIIVKLFSQESNKEIYEALRKYAPDIPKLNSLDSVRICESRKETFKFIEQKCKKINIPKTYNTLENARDASSNGTKIIIKLDLHNAPNISKENRIVGIARSPSDFEILVKNYNEEELFFQEYLGKFDMVYKVYIVDRWTVSITSHNRLQPKTNLSPLELIHLRVPIEKQLKRRLSRLGRKFGMSIFGVDYILTKEGVPFIVDVNDFPSFRSIPESVSLISDFIFTSVDRRQQIYKRIKVKG